MNDKSLFHLAQETSGSERPTFLEQACGGDAELRKGVKSLLRSDETPDSFLAAARSSPGSAPSGRPFP